MSRSRWRAFTATARAATNRNGDGSVAVAVCSARMARLFRDLLVLLLPNSAPSTRYGSLGAVIGFMTWMWLSVSVILIGAKLNAERNTRPPGLDRGSPKPMGARGAKMADSVAGPVVGSQTLPSEGSLKIKRQGDNPP